MKITFSKGELENFKKGWGCASFNCMDFCCSKCPIAPYMEDMSLEEAVQFIEEHLEK